MKAAQMCQRGGWDAANLEDIKRRQPDAGEVLVQMKAPSINALFFTRSRRRRS